EPLFHHHNTILNLRFKNNKFEFFKPFVAKKKILEIKKSLHKKITKYIPLDIEPEKLNLWFHYVPDYNYADIQDYENNLENIDGQIKLSSAAHIAHAAEENKCKILMNENTKEKYKDARQKRGRILRTLKYNTRTYLYDVGKFLDNPDYEIGEKVFSEFKHNFKKLVKLGCIKNRTKAYGFTHHLKRIIKKQNIDLFDQRYFKISSITSNCPVTQQRTQKIQDYPSPDTWKYPKKLLLTEDVVVYMAYKSRIIKLGKVFVK
ncbi:unnamed protein product, partial [marine sediment metagenome]